MSRTMYLMPSLQLLVAVCLVTSHALLAEKCAGATGVITSPKQVVLQEKRLPGEQPLPAKQVVLGKVGLQGVKQDTGVTRLTTMVFKLQLQQAELEKQASRLERALLLKGLIREVGKKILATNGKEVDFTTSKATCEGVGGKLATPINAEENNAILTFVKEFNRYAFLGIKESLLIGKFNYLDGTPVKYTNWSKNEPNGEGQEPCVEMYTDGKWNDESCNQYRLTICEI